MKSKELVREKPIKSYLLGSIAGLVLRAFHATWRWSNNSKEYAHLFVDGPPRILAFWHGRQLLMPWIYCGTRRFGSSRDMHVLISQHGDGRIISRAMSFFKIKSIAGSSSRGGVRALLELINIMKQGSHISVTPDGPRGPLYKVKPGLLKVAQKTGAEIIPVGASAQSRWQFGSWDKMILPKPFSRTVYVFGELLSVPKDASDEQLEQLALELERRLSTATEEADRYDYGNAS